MKQEQFLNLATAEEALKKFRDAVKPSPLGEEVLPLVEARGRVLSRDVAADRQPKGLPASGQSCFLHFRI